MSADTTRVPTAPKEGWTVETVLDYILAMLELRTRHVDELAARLRELIEANNKRLDERHRAQVTATDTEFASLRNELHSSLLALKEAVAQGMASADRAVSKAEVASEKRFEGVNEFRAQLGDSQRTLMPRAEAENRLNMLSDKVGVLEGFRTEVLSRGTGTKEGYGWAIGIVGVVLTVVTIVAAAIAVLSRLFP